MVKGLIAFVTLASAEPEVSGGTLSLTWEDCGDASTHGKISGIDKSSITLGEDTTVTGSGTVDEAVEAGDFTISSNAGPDLHGKVCEAKEFDLPLGLGKVNWQGLSCPAAAGDISVGVGIKLASIIPSKFAVADITVAATGSSADDKLLCMKIHTAPAVVADTCSLFEIADGSCGQSDLNCDYVKYAKAAEKGLADGTCADQGYTVQTGTQTKTYPVIGDIVITTYSKPSLDVGMTCESLCEFSVGTIKTLINKEGCVAAEVEGAAACEAAGGGPEDPIADLCAAIAGQACSLIADHMEESNSQICHTMGVCGGVVV